MEMVQEYIFLLPYQNNCGKMMMMMIMMIESIYFFLSDPVLFGFQEFESFFPG